MNRLRQKIEAIVFAGLKPRDPRNPGPAAADGPFQRLRERIDKFVTGGPAPNDPLYLTNRTWGQKIRAWSVVGLPLLLLAGGMALMLTRYLGPPVRKQAAEASPAE